MDVLISKGPAKAPPVPGRHVDKLDTLPDELLKKQDEAYLAKHQLDKLFADILEGLVTETPPDTVQYIIDCVAYSKGEAKQDSKTGLPEHRKAKLLDLFRVIDRGNTGRISFRSMQMYVNKYGGQTLNADELSSIFTDFKPGSDNLISQSEFLVFFSRVSKTITNAQFEEMVKELLA